MKKKRGYTLLDIAIALLIQSICLVGLLQGSLYYLHEMHHLFTQLDQLDSH